MQQYSLLKEQTADTGSVSRQEKAEVRLSFPLIMGSHMVSEFFLAIQCPKSYWEKIYKILSSVELQFALECL